MSPLRDLLHRPEGAPHTSFVLSGGGNLGALQVGMMRALLEHDIRPDLILGCSVGALNGAAIAADPTLAMLDRVQDLWLSMEGRDVLPAGLLPTTVQLARKGAAVHTNHALRGVIDDMLGPDRTFAELTVPYQCVATDVDAAREVWFTEGPMVDPILASAALPAMLPPVEIDGVRYIDGAVVNDVPVSRAVEVGATTIYVLHVGGFDRPRRKPKRPLDMALHAYWIARRARFTGTWRPCPRRSTPCSSRPVTRRPGGSTTSATPRSSWPRPTWPPTPCCGGGRRRRPSRPPPRSTGMVDRDG